MGGQTDRNADRQACRHARRHDVGIYLPKERQIHRRYMDSEIRGVSRGFLTRFNKIGT